MLEFIHDLSFPKKIKLMHMNIYKTYWFYWIYIMNELQHYVFIYFIWTRFEIKINVSILGFPNGFIVKKIKEKNASLFLTKGGVIWW